jgi:hypothetical protein
VTPFVYRRPDRFRLASLRSGARLGDERWTVDTADDLELVRDVVRRLGDPRAPWRAVLDLVPPTPAPGGWHVRIADADEPIALAAGVDPDDVGARVWVLDHDGEPRGWQRVEVHDGIGVVGGDAGNTPIEVVDALDRLLRADPQVVELVRGD